MLVRRRRTATLTYALLCSLAAGLLGCGNDQERLFPVEGKVWVGDDLLTTDAHTRGTVVLHPDKGKGNNSLEIPRGAIGADGSYRILTYNKSGAAPGWYRVTINAAKVIDPKNPYHSVRDFLVPERYLTQETSNLAIEVVERPDPGAYDLKLLAK
jgi:hypothetical protein